MFKLNNLSFFLILLLFSGGEKVTDQQNTNLELEVFLILLRNYAFITEMFYFQKNKHFYNHNAVLINDKQFLGM